eukprot:m.25399 g.25399  ORF g.25399 m.25399 type:complete len:53 (-) comp5762_c0_seq1:565-723(-)
MKILDSSMNHACKKERRHATTMKRNKKKYKAKQLNLRIKTVTVTRTYNNKIN